MERCWASMIALSSLNAMCATCSIASAMASDPSAARGPQEKK